MNCPFCRISSMRTVAAGDRELDRCGTCGTLWFDAGEIRELTEGHVAAGGEAAGLAGADAAGRPGDAARAGGQGSGGLLRKMHREAERLSCPRCGAALQAIDFQATGVPVFLCVGCRGYLAPRASAAAIDARFRFFRAHRAEYAALGERMAGALRRGADEAAGGAGARIPLPILVPLRDDGPATQSFPLATYLLIALSAVIYLYFWISGAAPRLPGGVSGLPPGGGAGAVPAAAILASPFLHAGLAPLLAGVLFLFVLGDNVEDRVGRVPFLILYVLCGAAAGVAQLLWGRASHPAALGSAGAVAGVLGAYLVFFPQVSITMYGLGRVASLPAYLFACAWVVAAFLIGPNPVTNFLNPAPLSFAGNLAGFGTGVLAATCWRLLEETVVAAADSR
ncbi:MAG: rhomboid family intramembrane serine protease [Gemmatimonadota bacterium]